jgi:hypothetical protein
MSSLEALKNPFAPALVKLPDGKPSASTALKLNASGVVDIPPNTTLELFILPTALNTISVTTDSPVFDTIQASAVPSDHVVKYDAYPGSGFFIPHVQNTIGHRIVSSGARFRLLNTDTFDDDGFWEAVRIPSYIPYKTRIGYQGSFDSNHLCTYTGMETINFSNVDCYQKGNLRDLDNYTFKLNHVTSTQLGWNDFGFSSDVVKQDFDVIVLRLTGRLDGLSKISWRTVCNQEVIYAPGTTLSKFHTACDIDPYFVYTMAQTREFLPGTLDGGW